MKHFFTLAFLIFTTGLFGQQWQQMDDYPGTARDDGTVFTIGNKVYCGLGMNSWFGCNGDFHVFDLDTENWSQGIEIPDGEARQYANGFSHNGFGYVFGGIDGSGNYRNDLWKFNPANNQWTSETTLNSAGRAGAVCFVISDTVYFIGGKSATVNALNEVWAYDLVNHNWSQKADLDAGIWRGVAFSWNGKGMVGLGKDNQNNLGGQFYLYSPAENSWETISGLSLQAASYTSASQIGNLAYLYGGMDVSGNYTNTFTRLNLENFQVHPLASFPSDARRGGMTFTGNDEFYVTTGVSSAGRLNETWKAGYVLSQQENVMDKIDIEVFPNPSAGNFSIQSQENLTKINICDLSGKSVFQKKCNSSLINVETDLPAGIYLMNMESENYSGIVKVIFTD